MTGFWESVRPSVGDGRQLYTEELHSQLVGDSRGWWRLRNPSPGGKGVTPAPKDTAFFRLWGPRDRRCQLRCFTNLSQTPSQLTRATQLFLPLSDPIPQRLFSSRDCCCVSGVPFRRRQNFPSPCILLRPDQFDGD